MSKIKQWIKSVIRPSYIEAMVKKLDEFLEQDIVHDPDRNFVAVYIAPFIHDDDYIESLLRSFPQYTGDMRFPVSSPRAFFIAQKEGTV